MGYYQYVLFLIPVFMVQGTELVHFGINFRKLHRQNQCNRRFTQIQTVAQHGGREGHYWAPKPNRYTVKWLYLGNSSE
jgi:hypothetical protein